MSDIIQFEARRADSLMFTLISGVIFTLHYINVVSCHIITVINVQGCRRESPIRVSRSYSHTGVVSGRPTQSLHQVMCSDVAV